jgi:hypothetical protein
MSINRRSVFISRTFTNIHFLGFFVFFLFYRNQFKTLVSLEY